MSRNLLKSAARRRSAPARRDANPEATAKDPNPGRAGPASPPAVRASARHTDVRGFAATGRYPCVLKPLHWREWEPLVDNHPLRWRKVVTAEDPEELLAMYRMAAAINPRVVVQELIQGPDTAKVVYMACYGQG